MKKKSSDKTKEKFGLKPFAFFSGVFDIIIAIAVFILTIFIFISLLKVADTGNAGLNIITKVLFMPIIIVIASIFVTGGVLFMVLGIVTIISSFKSDKYHWNGLLITVTVIDVFLFAGAVFMSFAITDNIRFFCIAISVLLGLGMIFKIVDIALTKKRVKEYKKIKLSARKTYTGPNFGNLRTDQNEQALQENSQNENDVDFSKLGQ